MRLCFGVNSPVKIGLFDERRCVNKSTPNTVPYIDFIFFLCFCTVVTAEVVVEFSVIVDGPVKCALLFATVDNILCEAGLEKSWFLK